MYYKLCNTDTSQGSWPSQSIEARPEIQASLYSVPCYSKSEQEKTTGSLAFLLPEVGGQACSLYGVRVGVCPGFGPEGKLKWFAHPLGGIVCRGHARYSVQLQAIQKWQYWIFLSLCIFCPEFAPTAHACSYF